MKIKKALISVSDKSNLYSLLKVLKYFDIKLISSGGTYKKIRNLGFKCDLISEFTKTPEILDGRVKTLHPKIHAGILNIRSKKSHVKQMKINNYKNIDLVIVNFYPFEKVLQKKKNHGDIIENIDIGGPTLVRAAAKNYNDVTVLSNQNQYKELITELKKNKGRTSLAFRKKMCARAFSEISNYDLLISNFFNHSTILEFPEKKIINANLVEVLRYGENPHQQAAIYNLNSEKFKLNQLSGKKLSYNNYNDILSALAITKSFPHNKGVAIIKHANPCGASIKKDNLESFKLSMSCDPVSSFGGIVSCNFKIDEKLARELIKVFFEIVICNGITKKALKILKTKNKLRIIDANEFKLEKVNNYFSNFNILLEQTSDSEKFNKKDFKVVSKVKPNKRIFNNLIFAFNMCRFVKSNAIVISKDFSTIGIGSGQPSRLDSCNLAIQKMRKFQKDISDSSIVAASDAFFPFVDGIEKLVQSGVKAIIQPSGSIRDKEIINFANETGTILVFSKNRHFKH